MAETFHTRITDDGRVVIPAPLRKELGLAPGSEVVLDRNGPSVRVRSYAQVVREVQDYCRRFAGPGAGAVDGLLADRRAEATREEADAAAWAAAFHPGAGRG